MTDAHDSMDRSLRAKLLTGACTECKEEDQVLDAVLARHFELRVCVTCKQDRNLRYGWYELITKSRAKSEFIVPDSLFHGLPFLTKPNPRHESFAPLKLYLKKTIQDEAERLYGDADGLARERASRKRKSYERAAQRTKLVVKKRRWGTIVAATEEERVNESGLVTETSSKQAQRVPAVDQDHRHEYGEELRNEDTNMYTKQCACGMTVEFEKW